VIVLTSNLDDLRKEKEWRSENINFLL
jgi:hypothetical protein